MTPKEIFLETLKPDGRPERMLKQYEAFGMMMADPINGFLRGNRKRGTTSKDRWGTQTSLFMSEEIWREFYKEPYRKFYQYIRSQGVIAIHHADSYLVPIIEDMIEIGIQVWQGTLPENDIPALLDQIDGRMVLMGGIGAAIDRADSTPDEIAAYTMHVLKEYCPKGHFIPSITYGAKGTIYPHVDPVIDETIDAYNRILHVPEYRKAHPVRRRKDAAVAQSTFTEANVLADSGVLDQISVALQKGQKKKVVNLCKEARAEEIGAQKILSDGLVKGMVELGDAFSAGKAFVPEMLLAARCMNAATDLLKEDLMGSSSESLGRICIGTVSGDMHDIGKNLVRIMMEGNGIEVIDLGTDVSAEEFVGTAVEKNCDMIVCSSLLTTTMKEMKRVVEVATERGVRDSIKIMIGGAPITQGYCEEIGADYYTDDAAAAAKLAVQVMKAR